MDIAMIETYLQQYDWEFERAENNVLVTGFATEETRFLVVIQMAIPWLRLSVPAYLPLPTGAVWPDFARLLLKLNHQSRLVRFAMDDSEHLTLCLDLYTESGLDYAQFEVALDALTYVAETAYPYLLTMGNSVLSEPKENE